MNERNICYNCFCERSESIGACPNCGYDPAWDADTYPLALPHGYVLCNKYILGRVLGQGGYGITYLAMDKWLGTKVAVKEYFLESGATRTSSTCRVTASSIQKQEEYQKGKEDFLQEARTLATLAGNPNIVHIYGYFEENNTAYFAMDYVQGITFKKYILNQGGKIPWKEAYEKLLPIITALEEVHQKGIIHRDISADNIYISSDGTMKLLDFGAARVHSLEKSQSLDVILKEGYAPYEQYMRRGKQGPFTDVYALCACFYMAATSYLPPDAPERKDADHIASFSAMGVQIPADLERVIFKGLAVNAQDRYQNMTELRNAMESALYSSEKDSQSKENPHVEYNAYNTTTQNTNQTQSTEKSKITKLGNKHKPLLFVIIGAIVIWGIIGIYRLTHNHTFEDYTIAKESTCTEDGLIKWECSCGAVKKQVAPASHKMAVVPEIAATCTQSGFTEGYACSICGYSEVPQQVVQALGHTPVTDAAVAPTCTTEGKTEGSHCSTCGEILVIQETLSAIDHIFVENVCQNCEQLEWWTKISSDKTTYETFEYIKINISIFACVEDRKEKNFFKIYCNDSLVQDDVFTDKLGNGDIGNLFYEDGINKSGLFEFYIFRENGCQIGYYSINVVE